MEDISTLSYLLKFVPFAVLLGCAIFFAFRKNTKGLDDLEQSLKNDVNTQFNRNKGPTDNGFF
jgi:hypothetical protein